MGYQRYMRMLLIFLFWGVRWEIYAKTTMILISKEKKNSRKHQELRNDDDTNGSIK